MVLTNAGVAERTRHPPKSDLLKDQRSPNRSWQPLSLAVFVGATLLGICLLGWFSVLTRPAQAASAIWWPASGLALGLGIHIPRRWLWLACAAVSMVLLGVNLAQYQTVTIAIAASVGAGLEMAIATLILRARARDVTVLETRKDLAILLLAIVSAAASYALIMAAATWAAGDPSTALVQLISAAPRRAAGMALVAPLFMRLPSLERRAGPVHMAIQFTLAFAVAVIVFNANGHLPLAFLTIAAPAWGALTVPPRWLIAELMGIYAIASYCSASGDGTFSFIRFGPDTGGALLQTFGVTMTIVVLVVSLTVARERSVAAQLSASELVYRRNFETSLAGMLVVVNHGHSWHVERYNRASADMLPELGVQGLELAHLLGPEATAAIRSAAERAVSRSVELEITSEDGRIFHVSLAPLLEEDQESTFSLQLLDVTQSRRAERLAAEEMQRAEEVQRALAPGLLPLRSGWRHGAAVVTARQVGGDFLDLRISGRYAVMSLGDVMGKGVGAGILAAASRTALRSVSPYRRPSEVLAESARIVDDDLQRSNAFVTVGYATVDLISGLVRLADAGHGLSFILRGGEGGVERLGASDLPLGLGNSWSEVSAELAPGDSLLMVSDGVLDRWGGSLHQLVDALESLRAELPPANTPQLFAEALCGSVDDADARGDDATAVILHREAGRT